MKYSIEPRDRIYVKGYGFMSFAKNYSQKIIVATKKSAMNAVKTASQRAIQKTAEETGDLVGNKISDKITSISKNSTKKLSTIDEDTELNTHKKRYISPEERQQIINEFRLVTKNINANF